MKIHFIIMVCVIACLPVVGFCQECTCLNCVTFDPLSLNNKYGLPAGNQPGDFIFQECEISVSVDSFLWSPSSGTFNFSQVDMPFEFFGKGNIMQTNNITLAFDFTQLGFTALYISFEFCDFGGFENIAVNGEPMVIGELADAVTQMPIGVFLDVVQYPVPGGMKGTGILRGVIQTLRIGGQEFWLDEVCAAELEPKCVTFDDVFTLGDRFGVPDDSAGSQIKVQNNITVSVDSFKFTGAGGTFNYCTIDTAFPWFGTTPIMGTNNINLVLDFSSTGFIVDCIEFEFLDMGGFENIAVNEDSIYAGELESAPLDIAPGVMMNIDVNPVPGGKKGYVKLVGPTTQLLLGGQEFWLDNICASRIVITDVENRDPQIDEFPQNGLLEQNYPNPFNPTTVISFQSAVDSKIKLDIVNVRGRRIRTLFNRHQNAGRLSVEWDGTDSQGHHVPSGIYICRLESTGSDGLKRVMSRKMSLIR